MRIRPDEEDAPEVDLAPLIDCVFLLLIFFLVATRLKTSEHEWKFQQPASVALSEKMSAERIVLNVSPGGRVKWGKEKFLLDNQKERTRGIKKIIALGTGSAIEIRADPQTESGRVLKLVDDLRIAGFEKIHIAVFSDVKRKKKR